MNRPRHTYSSSARIQDKTGSSAQPRCPIRQFRRSLPDNLCSSRHLCELRIKTTMRQTNSHPVVEYGQEKTHSTAFHSPHSLVQCPESCHLAVYCEHGQAASRSIKACHCRRRTWLCKNKLEKYSQKGLTQTWAESRSKTMKQLSLWHDNKACTITYYTSY